MISLQLVLKSYSNQGLNDSLINLNDDQFIYTDPKIIGPANYVSNKIIDEIILDLSQEEEIYLIKGTFDASKEKQKIIKMSIYTTLGQFIEFGKPSVDINFVWEYYFNLRYFDGFIIGWNEKNINYISSLVVEKQNSSLEEKNIILSDSTYESRLFNVEPIYLTKSYGKTDSYTIVDDDLIKLNLYNLAKEGIIYISEIIIFFDKFINSFDIEYTNRHSGEKFKAIHCGSDSIIF